MQIFKIAFLSGVVATTLLLGPSSRECLAGPTVVVGAQIPASERLPLERIDHSPWDSLLRKYVDERGMVNYRAWKASGTDQRTLNAYVNHLSAADISGASSREARLAYWINAYNAVTIVGILREYPTSSIRNHTAKLYGYNIWKDLKLQVADQQYSLDHMEHEILRKMREPRIHFAIVCASIGCPRLLREAYTPQNLEEQLTRNTQAFFADRSKFQYDANRRTIGISPIMKWFAQDFGTAQADQLRWVAPYFPDEAARQLAQQGQVKVSHLDYDWGLNDQNK